MTAKILVTGGLGFIGSNLIASLQKLPANSPLLTRFGDRPRIRVLDKRRPSESAAFQTLVQLENVEVISADVTDREVCERALHWSEGAADVVFHLAAQISVADSMERPAHSSSVNVQGTVNMLEAAHRAGVKRFVFASSAAVYGNRPRVPCLEEDAVSPASPYGLEKWMGEQYCRFFSDIYGLSTLCFRFFNAYGPGQAASGGYAAVIAQFMAAALRKQSVELHGDGSQTRDFIFVEDVAAALIAGAAAEMSGRVFNIGTARQTSVRELADAVLGLVPEAPRYTHGPGRLGDIRLSVADISKAKAELGFQPQVELGEGLLRYRDWLKKNL